MIENPADVATDADINYTLVNAYPNLAFSAAVFASGIPGDSRLVVVEQRGVLKVFENEESEMDASVILDISGDIEFGGEQGLLGLAFDPDFQRNRHLYLHYSMVNPRRSVFSRMTWSDVSSPIDPASEQIILEVEQPYSNHNGGMLAFGPDDYLYIALGDGGSGGDPENHAQNTATLLGSMLRLDVSQLDTEEGYRIPADNPFVNNAAFRPEIFAYGLRNPFRFSFDRDNGELWLADVGQDAREEINRVIAGGNYGWRVYEGTRLFDDSQNTLPDSAFISPVFEYGHDAGYSITGGYVYRGTQLPSLSGRYIYADYGSGTIWALTMGDTGPTSNIILATARRPTSFGETNDGELLVVTQSDGIFKLQSIE